MPPDQSRALRLLFFLNDVLQFSYRPVQAAAGLGPLPSSQHTAFILPFCHSTVGRSDDLPWRPLPHLRVRTTIFTPTTRWHRSPPLPWVQECPGQ